MTATLTVERAEGEAAVSEPAQTTTFEDCIAAHAAQDEFVALVLSIYGNAPRGWDSLFKLYDGIEDVVGGPRVIVSNGWAESVSETKRFTRSAHNRLVAGEEVRHIGPKKSSNKPANKTMTLSEAQAFIDRLVSGWLHSLCP